jgi:hypothetical protein
MKNVYFCNFQMITTVPICVSRVMVKKQMTDYNYRLEMKQVTINLISNQSMQFYYTMLQYIQLDFHNINMFHDVYSNICVL